MSLNSEIRTTGSFITEHEPSYRYLDKEIMNGFGRDIELEYFKEANSGVIILTLFPAARSKDEGTNKALFIKIQTARGPSQSSLIDRG